MCRERLEEVSHDTAVMIIVTPFGCAHLASAPYVPNVASEWLRAGSCAMGGVGSALGFYVTLSSG